MNSKLLLKLSFFLIIFVAASGAKRAATAQPISKVDIFFLFDETGSFSTFAPQVIGIYNDLVRDLESNLPGIEFGFGVGSFKDFGGPGWDFCSNHSEVCEEDFPRRVNGRPFYLHQPIVTAATAGGSAQRDALIVDALGRNGPGTGGDDPESHIEAFWQIATGAGFDGNGDGALTGLSGNQVAGAIESQLTPDDSGDVPPFSSLAAQTLSSGQIGGAGFRPDALKLVIIATEICAALPFSAGSVIPAEITGRYSTEMIADFACRSVTIGDDRFGYVGNAKSFFANTVANAVVPVGAANFPETIATLNAADIRIISMGPGLGPRDPGSGPGHEPSGFLSALARITGGVDAQGVPLVFDIGNGGSPLKEKLLSALTSAAVVNPGCQTRDFTTSLASLSAVLGKQKKMAIKQSKKFQSERKFKKTKKSVNRGFKQTRKTIQAFPPTATVCGNNACPATDQSAALAQINAFGAKVSKLINSAIKKSSRKSRRAATTQRARVRKKKQSTKLAATAAALASEFASQVSVLPSHTNVCS